MAPSEIRHETAWPIETAGDECQLTLVIDYGQREELAIEERRQDDRSDLIIDVHFDGAESTGVASTKNISRGGLYMSTRMAIPVGATLDLRIPIGNQHVAVKGEVVYSNPGEGVGVKFQELPEDARRLMEQLVTQA